MGSLRLVLKKGVEYSYIDLMDGSASSSIHRSVVVAVGNQPLGLAGHDNKYMASASMNSNKGIIICKKRMRKGSHWNGALRTTSTATFDDAFIPIAYVRDEMLNSDRRPHLSDICTIEKSKLISFLRAINTDDIPLRSLEETEPLLKTKPQNGINPDPSRGLQHRNMSAMTELDDKVHLARSTVQRNFFYAQPRTLPQRVNTELHHSGRMLEDTSRSLPSNAMVDITALPEFMDCQQLAMSQLAEKDHIPTLSGATCKVGNQRVSPSIANVGTYRYGIMGSIQTSALHSESNVEDNTMLLPEAPPRIMRTSHAIMNGIYKKLIVKGMNKGMLSHLSQLKRMVHDRATVCWKANRHRNCGCIIQHITNMSTTSQNAK